MILSRQRPAASDTKKARASEEAPTLETFLDRRDYRGAITLLEFNVQAGLAERFVVLPWLAYSYFHLGDHKKALDIYDEIIGTGDTDPMWHLYRGCCLFFLGFYQEAEAAALRGPSGGLQTRLLFHLAHKSNDEAKLMSYHSQLKDSVADQLSLASIHHLRSHYQESTDIYKRLLLENRNHLALNVYIALCYFKLDFFDVSLEVLNFYLQEFPTSVVGVNLKAANQYRIYNGKVADNELKVLENAVAEPITHPLILHNKVVFQNGEGALKVLPELIGVIPEARLNLVIYYLKQGEFKEAYDLMVEVEPTTPPEYILKGIVNAAVGQKTGSQQHLKAAQQYFNLVGASPSECDTIAGRQAMASCFALAEQFSDVLIYLKSIESFFSQDDAFLFNFGIAKAHTGVYKEALEHFTQIKSDKVKADPVYLQWLCKCYIMVGKAREAWNIYSKLEANSSDAMSILLLIANDSYRMGAFLIAARAFDVLERVDPNPDFYDGKVGACVGVFQAFLAERESRDTLSEVVNMLRSSSASANPQTEYVLRVIRKYAGN